MCIMLVTPMEIWNGKRRIPAIADTPSTLLDENTGCTLEELSDLCSQSTDLIWGHLLRWTYWMNWKSYEEKSTIKSDLFSFTLTNFEPNQNQ